MVVPVVVDNVVADGERGPVWHARAAEHPQIVEAGGTELGLDLVPESAFPGGRDGLAPGGRRPREGGLIQCGRDAFADGLLEQGRPDAGPGENPDAVVDLVGQVTREPEVQGPGQ